MKNTFVLLVLILFSCSAWATLTDGLVLHCEFEGNVQDSSPNNFHGTIRSGVSYTTGVDGQAGSAAYFENSTAGIQFGNQSQINNLGDLFSMAFWIKIEAGNGGNVFDHDIVGTRDDCWWGGVSSIDGTTGVVLGNATPGHLNGNTSIDDGTWHHVLLMRDQATGNAWWYVDGNLDATLTGRTNHMLGSTTFNLGAMDMVTGSNWAHCFTGAMDDFRLYNRLLSENEIQTLAVPEPATLSLLALGGLLLRKRK